MQILSMVGEVIKASPAKGSIVHACACIHTHPTDTHTHTPLIKTSSLTTAICHFPVVIAAWNKLPFFSPVYLHLLIF